MKDTKHGKRALGEIGYGHYDGHGHGHSELSKIEDHHHKKRAIK